MPSESASSDDDSDGMGRANSIETPVPETSPPDEAYVALLDGYIDTFFSLDYLEIVPRIQRTRHLTLYPSKVTIDRAYYQPRKSEENSMLENSTHGGSGSHHQYENQEVPEGHRDDDIEQDNYFESLPGSLWTAAEKEFFFRCLARYSIHRVENFSDHLPNKSVAEIIQYYNLLKNELHKLETYKEHTVLFRDTDADPTKKVAYNYTSRAFEDGATYSEIPIACELSESWISYEEEQSSKINTREYKLALNKEKRRRKQMFYKYGHAVGSVGDTHQFGIINTYGLIHLQKIYRGSEYASGVGRKQVRVFRFDTMVLLNELIRQRIQDIVGTLIVSKGLEGVAPGEPEFDLSENGDLYRQFALSSNCVVARADIYRACESLGMFEAPTSGYSSKNRDGKMPVIDPYWLNLQRSLKLRIEDTGALYGEAPQVKYYCKQIQQYVEKDAFSAPLDPQSEEWDFDGKTVDFSARGDLEEIPSGSDDCQDETSRSAPSYVGKDLDMSSSTVAKTTNNITVTDILELPTVAPVSKRKNLEDALVEELLYIKETRTLDATDSKHDVQLHARDSRRYDIKRRKLDPPTLVPSSLPEYFDDMWGSTDMETFCEPSLRRSWNHVFPRY